MCIRDRSSDDNKVFYRTGAEVLSDIGASAESSDLEISNASDNRVVTSSGGTDLNAEANLTFDGSDCTLTGNLGVSGYIRGPLDGDIRFISDGNMDWTIDSDNDESGQSFRWYNNLYDVEGLLMDLGENGHLQIGGLGTSVNTGNLSIVNSNNDATGPTIRLQSQRGATGSVSDAQDNDVLGHINFLGYDLSLIHISEPTRPY